MVAWVAAGEGFKVYPGAATYTPPDTEEARQANKALAPETTSTIYTTNDSDEKVVEFYKRLGKEYTIPGMPKSGKLPSGQELKHTIFCLRWSAGHTDQQELGIGARAIHRFNSHAR